MFSCKSNSLFPFLFWIILVINILFFGISYGSTTGPLKILISAREYDPDQHRVEILCTLTSAVDLDNAYSCIYLPDDLVLVSGNKFWEGKLVGDQTASYSLVCVSRSPGSYLVDAIVNSQVSQDTIYSAMGRCGFTVDSRVSAGRIEFSPARFEAHRIPSPISGTSLTDRYNFPLNRDTHAIAPPPSADLGGLKNYPDTHGSSDDSPVPARVTLKGRWFFYDRDDLQQPASTFLVEAVDGKGNNLAWGYTDDSGYFSLGMDTNPTWLGIAVRIYTYVKYDPHGFELIALDNGGTSVSDAWFMSTPSEIYGDGIHDVGSWTVPNNEWVEPAFWIKDDLDRGYRFCPDKPGSIIVEWSPLSTDGTYYKRGEHIHLTATDPRSSDLVIHEMGHNVHWYIYDDWLPWNDCPSPHFLTKQSGYNCAWLEGFASFWAILVNNDPVFNWPGGGTQNLELPSWGSFGWDDGFNVEGRVACALWDMIDEANDGYEGAHEQFLEMWEVLTAQRDGTIIDFWTAWKDDFRKNYSCVLSAFYQNTIDFGFFASKTVRLCKGLNFSSVPLGASAFEVAEDIILAACPGFIDAVWKHDCTAQSFNSYTLLDTGGGFPISPGTPIIINSTRPSDCNWFISGHLPCGIHYDLCKGLNLVTVPEYSLTITKASGLLTAVPNCNAIWQWKPETNCSNPPAFRAYFPLSVSSDNFDINRGACYWINVTAGGTWNPPNP